MEISDVLPWVFSGIGIVVSTLAGIVAMFYRQQITDYKSNESTLKKEVSELKVRADACERDRESLRIAQARLEERVQVLEKSKA